MKIRKKKKKIKKEGKQRKRVEEEFFKKYYETSLTLDKIEFKKDIGKEEKLILKYVRSYNEQFGPGIKGKTIIEALKKRV